MFRFSNILLLVALFLAFAAGNTFHEIDMTKVTIILLVCALFSGAGALALAEMD